MKTIQKLTNGKALDNILLRFVSQNRNQFIDMGSTTATSTDFINQVEMNGKNYDQQINVQNAADIFQYGIILKEQQELIQQLIESVNNLENMVAQIQKRLKKDEKCQKKLRKEVNRQKKKCDIQKSKNRKYYQQVKLQTKAICALSSSLGISKPSNNLKKIVQKCIDFQPGKSTPILAKREKQNQPVLDVDFKEVD